MLLKILSLLAPELAHVSFLKSRGIDIKAVTMAISTVEADVANLKDGKLVSLPVGSFDVAGLKCNVGVYAQKA